MPDFSVPYYWWWRDLFFHFLPRANLHIMVEAGEEVPVEMALTIFVRLL
jgi:hypothetical protein